MMEQRIVGCNTVYTVSYFQTKRLEIKAIWTITVVPKPAAKTKLSEWHRGMRSSIPIIIFSGPDSIQ